MGLHETKAFPSKPVGQVHIGIWFMTSQRAFCAHVPGQGSTHLLLRHALSRAQSEFNTHSGRQPIYGSPWNSIRQVHVPSSHREFAPHGEGLHLS